jgi:hypothetical protein
MSLPKVTEVPTNAGELAESREIPEDGPNESPIRHHESLPEGRSECTRSARMSPGGLREYRSGLPCGPQPDTRNCPLHRGEGEAAYDQAHGKGFEDMERRVPDTEKINAAIGSQPTFSLDETLDAAIAYFRQNPPATHPKPAAESSVA